MDDPGLDPVEHRRALAGLRRINRWSGTGPRLARALEAIARDRQLNRLSVLDMGCGGGDIAFEVAKSIDGRLEIALCGWDRSPTAIEMARSQPGRRPLRRKLCLADARPQLRFEVQDVFQPSPQSFDVVYCCLFLHHFTDRQVVELLLQMRKLARHSVIVDDLCRTFWGWCLAKVGCRLLSRSPVVHFDGPQSVRAAFTMTEVERLAAQAGLHGATIRGHWPERFLLRWDAAR